MTKRNKVLTVAVVALAAFGSLGYVVWAQTSSETSSNSYLARVAEKLGVTEGAVLQAMYEARAEMIEERVAAGELTPAQADYLKAVLKARIDYYAAEGCDPDGAFGLGMGMRSRAPGRGFRGCPDSRWEAAADD